MSRVISVNWADLNKIAEEFLVQAQDAKKINEDLESHFESINDCWKGADSENFIKNSKKINNSLNTEVNHLATWCEYLNKSSGKYNENVEEGLMEIKKSEEYYEEIK